MGGWSDKSICPECRSENFMIYGANKPYDNVGGECLDCGFHYYTADGHKSLKDVNERRKDYGLKPLKKLKERR